MLSNAKQKTELGDDSLYAEYHVILSEIVRCFCHEKLRGALNQTVEFTIRKLA